MRQKGRAIGIACLLTFAMFVLQSGCNKTPDINRVSPNYMRKSALDGEWYMRAVLVDKQHDSGSAFIGIECGTERVRFELTEKYLNAYRSYEAIVGSEDAKVGNQSLVAQFPVMSYFDIRRKYNPQNGVQSNVIVENTQDRPWHEREYVRIDWSANQLSDRRCNAWIESIGMQNISRNVSNDPKDPYRLRIEDGYIENTVESILQPDPTSCWMVGDWNCPSTSAKMRWSFKRISQNDYVPEDYPDSIAVHLGKNSEGEDCVQGDKDCKDFRPLRVYYGPLGEEPCDLTRHSPNECVDKEIDVFKRFGFFRTTVDYFDRQKGFLHQNRQQLINRQNIWKVSRNADGGVIPLKERLPKPIVYHLSVGFPKELEGAAAKLAAEWNRAFVHAVGTLKSECTLASANHYAKVHNLMPILEAEKIPAITASNLKEACAVLGRVSLERKLEPPFMSGDEEQMKTLHGNLFQVRVNSCNEKAITAYAKTHALQHYLDENGFSTLLADNLEEACAVLEWAAIKEGKEPVFSWQRLGDLRYSLINYSKKEELESPLGYGPTAKDPQTGEIIAATVNLYGASLEAAATRGADIVAYLNGDISQEDVQFAHHIEPKSSIDPASFALFTRTVNDRLYGMTDAQYTSGASLASIEGQEEKLHSSHLEEKYALSPDMVHLFAPDGKTKSLAKPSSWIHSSHQHLHRDADKSAIAMMDRKIEHFGEHNACFFAHTVEPAVADFAVHLKGKSWEEAYQIILENMMLATALHEVGHTLGLRHNFEGSYDAMNYIPAAFGIDTHNHLMPRENTRPFELRYSSIMDYHQRFNSNFGGIGPYDFAAIARGYAGLVEVFDESEGPFVPRELMDLLHLFHYTDLPYLFGSSKTPQAVLSHYNTVRTQFMQDDTAHVDVKSLNLAAKAENLYKRSYIPFERYKREVGLQYVGRHEDGQANFFAVPYRFCTDAHVDTVNVSCNMWDMGASAEEIVDNAAQRYEFYYPFTAFRHDRLGMSPRSYQWAFKAHTLNPMTQSYRSMYFSRRSSTRLWPIAQDWMKASYKSLNFMARVLQTVEPGKYCMVNGSYVPEQKGQPCDQPIDVAPGEGRYFRTHYSKEFNSKPENMGHIYDKMVILSTLTDANTFFSKDFSQNLDRMSQGIGYYRLFAPEMIKLFSSMVRGDVDHFSPFIENKNGHGVVHYRPLFDLAKVQASAQTMPLIKPTFSWSLRYLSAIWPMYKFSNPTDGQLDYAKRARITIVGSAYDPHISLAARQMLFTDPYSHVQYRAVAVDDPELSLGYQLLRELVALTKDADANGPQGSWKAAKDQVDALMQSQATAVLLTKAKDRFAQEDKLLREKMQMVDLLRRLSEQ